MPHVALTLNGRVYRFVCEPGEEDHFRALARYLENKVNAVKAQFGKVGDERLLAMAALLVTDELFDLRASVAATPAAAALPQRMSARSPKPKVVKAVTEVPPVQAEITPVDRPETAIDPPPES